MADASYYRPECDYALTLAAAASAGEVRQLPNGLAAVKAGTNSAASGDRVSYKTEGQYTVTKTATQVWIDGAPIWWDHSANAATCVPAIDDRDFYLGTAVGDAASADTEGTVNLNVKPAYIIDTDGVMGGGGGDSVVVLTAGTPYVYSRGGVLELAFSATAEAQKVDYLSRRSFPLASNWVAEFEVEIVTAADNAAADISVGVANATHATDADAITESAFFHIDGASTNINAESDDGTTEVAATDTTLDFTAGTRLLLALDGRDPSNVKYYVNGVEVLSGTANLGNIAAATGPLKLLVHAEKTSDDSPLVMQVTGRVRIAEQ